MSLATIENAIVRELKTILNNPRVTKKHLMEWSTSEDAMQGNIIPEEEVYVFIPCLNVHCAVLKEADKRKPAEEGDAN